MFTIYAYYYYNYYNYDIVLVLNSGLLLVLFLLNTHNYMQAGPVYNNNIIMMEYAHVTNNEHAAINYMYVYMTLYL